MARTVTPAENLNPNWLDASVNAVVQSLTADVEKYDEARLTKGELVERIKSTVEHTIVRTYDHGFDHGVDAQFDDEDDEDEEDPQMEFDLDDLRQIGEDDEEE